MRMHMFHCSENLIVQIGACHKVKLAILQTVNKSEGHEHVCNRQISILITSYNAKLAWRSWLISPFWYHKKHFSSIANACWDAPNHLTPKFLRIPLGTLEAAVNASARIQPRSWKKRNICGSLKCHSAAITIKPRIHRIHGAKHWIGHHRSVVWGHCSTSWRRRRATVHSKQSVGPLEDVAAEHSIICGTLWCRWNCSLNGGPQGCTLGRHWKRDLRSWRFHRVRAVKHGVRVSGGGQVGPRRFVNECSAVLDSLLEWAE